MFNFSKNVKIININNSLCYEYIRIGWCEDRCEDMYVVNMYISIWPKEPKMNNLKFSVLKEEFFKKNGK